MSTTTSNLGLFKYDTIADANTAFNIDVALNQNWDIIDNLNLDILPNQTGKNGYILSTNGTYTYWRELTAVQCVLYTYNSVASWYRKWSDGFIEQGSSFVQNTQGTNVTFPLSFSNTNYTLIVSCSDNDTNAKITSAAYLTSSKAANGFTVYNGYGGTFSAAIEISYYVCGF